MSTVLGMTPQQAIKAATSVAADLLGVDAGVIAAGRPADLLVLDADAGADVRALRDPRVVIKGGGRRPRARVTDVRGLKVAILGAISWPSPPPGYGPWEQVAYNIARGMAARGADVTLFATANSSSPGKLAAVVPVGLNEDPAINGEVYSELHVASCFARASEFDLIHNSFDWKPLLYALATSAPPVLTTVHGFSSPQILAAYYAGAARSFYCSISDADRDPGLAYLATAYNGIDPSQWTFRDAPATICCSSRASIPRRARTSRSRSPSAPACA